MTTIPVAKVLFGEEEAAMAREAILSGWVTQGPRVQALEDAFAAYCGAPHARAVANCTTALHLALLGAGVGPGDAVVTVSHSFIATANAVRHCGAEPFFVDIEGSTFNMDPSALERALIEEFENRDGEWHLKRPQRLALGESPWVRTTPPLGRLGAILVVHQVGLPADLPRILAIAGRFGVPVIEDAACAVGAEIRMSPDAPWERIGTPHGLAACFSLHPRKIITTGEGGLITTADADLHEQFRLLRQHGMSLSDLARHSSPTTTESYVTTGYNYRLTDIQAVIGLVQLARLEEILPQRGKQAEAYTEMMKGIDGVTPPTVPAHARHNWQSYIVLLDPGINRESVAGFMAEAGVATRPGVMNAHAEAPYDNAWPKGSLPVSEFCRAQGLMLPMHPLLSELEQERVVHVLRKGVEMSRPAPSRNRVEAP